MNPAALPVGTKALPAAGAAQPVGVGKPAITIAKTGVPVTSSTRARIELRDAVFFLERDVSANSSDLKCILC
jgi:hypothetical protein